MKYRCAFFDNGLRYERGGLYAKRLFSDTRILLPLHFIKFYSL
ncbi:hypothetical protein NEIELOOT_00323 [Neisseria elongata subsp. glycolytica ATCC 29315]|uniref:Uncharacterized protein n=1 Tax=Neisseria elongata subsp. glycolytica ATCC 29315 TaxID=546263 RepID=D4DMP8_NEIEG|nr:hypothetical protein NEIELOOT_00323 [Neisseria elongata subsp. glycolytica ATCC 29315]